MTIYQQIAQNRFKTYLIFIVFILIFSGLFYMIGWYTGDPFTYLVLGLLISSGSAFFSYFYSDKVVLATVHAKPATKEEFFDYYTVTENLSIAAGLPMPRLYIIQDDAMNAFATGRNPKHGVVCATTGLLKKLERSEIEGVVAHELAHIKNYDILVMSVTAVLVGTIALVTDFAMRGMWFRGSDNRRSNGIMLVLYILALVLTPIIAQMIQLAVSRRREYLADASAALITRNPDALANALIKISGSAQPLQTATTSTAHLFFSNPFQKGSKTANWFTGLFSTHPPVEERIKALRAM